MRSIIIVLLAYYVSFLADEEEVWNTEKANKIRLISIGLAILGIFSSVFTLISHT